MRQLTSWTMPILLADEDPRSLRSLRSLCLAEGLEHLLTLSERKKLLPFLSEQYVGLIVLDLSGDWLNWGDLISAIINHYPYIPLLTLVEAEDREKRLKKSIALKKGAFDCLTKPINDTIFINTLKKALTICPHRHDQRGSHHLPFNHPKNVKAFTHFITRSQRMMQIFQYVEAIARSSPPLLITGEKGVGKELLARSLHLLSQRKGSFKVFDSDRLKAVLHASPSLHGKKGDLPNKLMSEGGTLLLDEIGSLSLPLQHRLLKLLDHQKNLFPQGNPGDIEDVGIISTTSQLLGESVRQGLFLERLYNALGFHQIHIPPLRERPEDIPLLADYFLEMGANRLNLPKEEIPEPFFERLMNYPFPENVRELKDLIDSALMQGREKGISLKALDDFFSRQRIKG